MEENKNNQSVKFYQTWWGMAVILILLAVTAVALIFAFFVGKYWWMVKQGNIEELENKFKQTQQIGLPAGDEIRLALETNDDPYFGNPNASVVIVEFVDYKCPFCKDFYPIFNKLMSQYGQKIKFIIRDFPSESLHPGASKFAEIAQCAYDQGRYLDILNLFFNNQDELVDREINDDFIKEIALAANLDTDQLLDCVSNGKNRGEVNKDYSDGLLYGAGGTPTFFINGEKVEGVLPFEFWENLLQNI